MERESSDAGAERAPQDDCTEFTSYEDGRGIVVCDTKNPKAWIASDEPRPVAP